MNSDYHIITTGGTIDSLGIHSSKEYILKKQYSRDNPTMMNEYSYQLDPFSAD